MKKVIFLVGVAGLFWATFPVVGKAIDTIGTVYSSATKECQTSAVGSTGTNRITANYVGYYEVTPYTSVSDFSGVGVKCLQGGSSVTVDGKTGWKIPAGASKIRFFGGGAQTISCQTASGNYVYDICYLDPQ